MIDIIIFFLILFIPIAAFITMYMMYNNSSDGRIYQKNLFDWIVYVLAWLAVPFFSVSCFVLDPVQPPTYRYTLMKGKNWEERRRKNLYITIFLLIILGLVGLIAQINFDFILGYILLLIFYVFLLILFCLLTEKYEKHIESKSYVPENDTTVSHIEKSKRKNIKNNHLHK